MLNIPSDFRLLTTHVPPTTPSVEALDAAPAGDKAFYRVRAQR